MLTILNLSNRSLNIASSLVNPGKTKNLDEKRLVGNVAMVTTLRQLLAAASIVISLQGVALTDANLVDLLNDREGVFSIANVPSAIDPYMGAVESLIEVGTLAAAEFSYDPDTKTLTATSDIAINSILAGTGGVVLAVDSPVFLNFTDATEQAPGQPWGAHSGPYVVADEGVAGISPCSLVRSTALASAPDRVRGRYLVVTDGTAAGALVILARWADVPFDTGTLDFAVVGLSAPVVAGSPALFFGQSWDRPDPATTTVGSEFMNSTDLAVQVSSGLALGAPGAAATGWLTRLPTGLGPQRASLTMRNGTAGATGRIYRTGVDLTALKTNKCAFVIMFRWNAVGGSGVAGINSFLDIGDQGNVDRGCHAWIVINGANFDLVAGSGGVVTVLLPSINLVGTPNGLHCLAIEPVFETGVHSWRWSLDGAAPVDTVMGAAYATPNNADCFAVGGRGDNIIPLAGDFVDCMVFLTAEPLSGAALVELSTLPALPANHTYEIPESATAGGTAQIRVQARRFDPGVAGFIPCRGLPVGSLIVENVTKVSR